MTLEEIKTLQEARYDFCILYCRAKDFSCRERRKIDEFLGKAAGLTRRSFRDVRLCRRDLSKASYDRLVETLDEMAPYLEKEALILCRQSTESNKTDI